MSRLRFAAGLLIGAFIGTRCGSLQRRFVFEGADIAGTARSDEEVRCGTGNPGAISGAASPRQCWRDVPGGFKGNFVYEAVIDKFASTGSSCAFVEIGALMGQSTCYMARALRRKNITHVKFDVIDFWASLHDTRSDVSHSWLTPEQMQAAQRFGKGEMSMAWHYYMLHTESWGMLNNVFHASSTDRRIVAKYKNSSVDFVYLDTAHDARVTRHELSLWWPKVKIGGWLCGDDYDPSTPQSSLRRYREAVDTWFGARGFRVKYWGQQQFCVENTG